MAELIPARGVHHFRLTVSHVDRAVAFYMEVLGLKKLMDLNAGAFLSNGQAGLGIGPHHAPDHAIRGDRFDENRVGLDHLSFGVGIGPTSSTPSESSTSGACPTP
jgi:catechol 2,3-dioxygenase-like lactoylglutathione lyase family enzyme